MPLSNKAEYIQRLTEMVNERQNVSDVHGDDAQIIRDALCELLDQTDRDEVAPWENY